MERLLPDLTLVGERFLPGQVVLVDGDRIVAVGPDDGAGVPIRLSRRALLPGCVDTGRKIPPRLGNPRTDARVALAEALLRGVTTVAVRDAEPEVVRAAAEVGIRLVRDAAPGGTGDGPASVYAAMRTWGLDPAAALRRGTLEAAAALGVCAGAIEAGRLADLVALDLDDLSTLPHADLLGNVVRRMEATAVRDVMVGGTWVVRERALLTMSVRNLVRELSGDRPPF